MPDPGDRIDPGLSGTSTGVMEMPPGASGVSTGVVMIEPGLPGAEPVAGGMIEDGADDMIGKVE